MIELPRNIRVKKITSYPVLLGVLIGLLLCAAIMAEESWFPSLGQALGKHERFVQGIYFTLFYFCVWIYIMWNRHRKPMFWVSFAILFLVHVAGVLFFSLRYRPLLVSEWALMGILESYLIAAVVYLSTRDSNRADRL
jgi:hypothetical protein